MPTASKFSAVPDTIWSARSVMANTAWIEREQRPGEHGDDQPADPRVRDVRAPDAEERAHEHHALERDVDHAAALGEQPAERAEEQRRGVAQRRGQQRAPDDDLLEVADAGQRRGQPAGDAGERPRRSRPSPAAASPRLHRRRRRRRGRAREDRHGHRRAHVQRRHGDEERQHGQRDRGPAEDLGRSQPRADATARRRRGHAARPVAARRAASELPPDCGERGVRPPPLCVSGIRRAQPPQVDDEHVGATRTARRAPG